MAKQNYVEFRNYLRTIISNYHSQAEFASVCDLSPEHLNRLLNNPVIARPTKKTLQKIAGHSRCGITVKMLIDACDLENTEEKEYSFKEENKKIADLILSGLQDTLKNPPYRADSLQGFLANIDMVLRQYEISYTFEDVPYPIEDCPTEKSTILSFSWKNTDSKGRIFSATDSTGKKYRGNELYVSLDVLVLYDETSSGILLISGLKTDQKTLLNAGSPVATDIMEADQYKEDGLCMEFSFRKPIFRRKRKGMTAEERLLKNIFGEGDEPKRISTAEGIGFYLNDKSFQALPSFVKKHKDTLKPLFKDKSFQMIYQNAIEEGNLSPDDTGLCRRILEDIIYKETDIVVTAYIDYPEDTGTFDNTPCVILEKAEPWAFSDTERELTEESLIQILDKYARELHTEVEECYFTTLVRNKKYDES